MYLPDRITHRSRRRPICKLPTSQFRHRTTDDRSDCCFDKDIRIKAPNGRPSRGGNTRRQEPMPKLPALQLGCNAADDAARRQLGNALSHQADIDPKSEAAEVDAPLGPLPRVLELRPPTFAQPMMGWRALAPLVQLNDHRTDAGHDRARGSSAAADHAPLAPVIEGVMLNGESTRLGQWQLRSGDGHGSGQSSCRERLDAGTDQPVHQTWA
ncbi:MAG: hypothetical protein Kow0020_07880 [Wenzhouxiangellaceae bacterium]